MNSLALKPWRWLTGFFCDGQNWRAAAAFSAIAFGVTGGVSRCDGSGELLAGRLMRRGRHGRLHAEERGLPSSRDFAGAAGFLGCGIGLGQRLAAVDWDFFEDLTTAAGCATLAFASDGFGAVSIFDLTACLADSGACGNLRGTALRTAGLAADLGLTGAFFF